LGIPKCWQQLLRIMIPIFNRYKIFSALILILIFKACVMEQPKQVIEVNIAINKEYPLNITKYNFLKKFRTNPLGINLDTAIKDSIYDFGIEITGKWSILFYKTTVIQKSNDSLVMTLDSILECLVRGPAFTGIKTGNISFCKSLKRADYIKYFDSLVIKRIENNKAPYNEHVVLNLR
jgi:hypothetical protein